MSIVVGNQVPVTPSLEVVGKAGAVPFKQILGIALNVGVIVPDTVTDKVAVVAHKPVVGVNVYIVVPAVVVEIVVGFQVPVIPSLEVVGNDGAAAF